MSRRRSFARQLGRGLFWAWIPLALVLGSTLLAAHEATLPVPDERDARLLAELADMRHEGDEQRWLAVHVLYAACRCSGDVVRHLARDPRPPGIAERILLVGSTPEIEQRIAASGIEVIRTSPDELAERYAIEAAPLLLVADPEGTMRYRGGYTDRKRSGDLHDTQIIEQLRTAGDATALPLFGCAVSDELRALLDPLGVRGGGNP